jgi:hypothetical protein
MGQVQTTGKSQNSEEDNHLAAQLQTDFVMFVNLKEHQELLTTFVFGQLTLNQVLGQMLFLMSKVNNPVPTFTLSTQLKITPTLKPEEQFQSQVQDFTFKKELILIMIWFN